MLYCISACLLSGYIGGYHLDKQMKAGQTGRIFVKIPEKFRKLFHFYSHYSKTILLSALIVESSGILFSVFVLLTTIVLPTHQPLFSFALLLAHSGVLLFVGFVTYVQFLRTKRRKTEDRRLLRCEIKKLLFTTSVQCAVVIIETPDMRTDGMYLVKCGRLLPQKIRADKLGSDIFCIGNSYYALYRDKAPHLILIPDHTKNNSRNA